MMSSFLGGGYDAPRTPSMSRGDEESIEESKLPESTVVGAGDSGGIDPHGDVSRADVTQDVSDIQRDDDDDDDCRDALSTAPRACCECRER